VQFKQEGLKLLLEYLYTDFVKLDPQKPNFETILDCLSYAETFGEERLVVIIKKFLRESINAGNAFEFYQVYTTLNYNSPSVEEEILFVEKFLKEISANPTEAYTDFIRAHPDCEGRINSNSFGGFSNELVLVESNYEQCLNQIKAFENPDVEVEVVDLYGNTKLFKGHKAIIAMNSLFFESLFLFEEKALYKHETPLSMIGFEYLFNYFYGNEFEIENPIDMLLLVSIDFYQISKKDETAMFRNTKRKLAKMNEDELFETIINEISPGQIEMMLAKNIFPMAIKSKIEKFFAEQNEAKKETQ